MQEYIEKRVLEICEYIIQTGATVRQAATQFWRQQIYSA